MAVLLTERAAGDQGNSQGSEVAGAYHIIRGCLGRKPGGASGWPSTSVPRSDPHPIERESTPGIGGLDGGQSPHSFQKLLEEGSLLFRLGVLVSGEGDSKRQQVMGVETGIDRNEINEASSQETGAYQQDDSQRDLRRHQDAPDPVLFLA